MKTKIEQLLERPEGKQLEFKQDLSSTTKIMRTIIAFANSSGGTIVVGIEDGSKKIVGIENILDEEERISNIIADSISPRLVPSVEVMSFEGKDLLLIEVYISGLRPHFIFPMPGYSVGVLSEKIRQTYLTISSCMAIFPRLLIISCSF